MRHWTRSLTRTLGVGRRAQEKYNDLLKRGDRHMSYKVCGAAERVTCGSSPSPRARCVRCAQASKAALLIMLFQDQPILYMPHQLLTVCLDVDEHFTQWRHRHALMVHRMLGTKMGTGGSSGYQYLRASANVRVCEPALGGGE